MATPSSPRAHDLGWSIGAYDVRTRLLGLSLTTLAILSAALLVALAPAPNYEKMAEAGIYAPPPAEPSGDGLPSASQMALAAAGSLVPDNPVHKRVESDNGLTKLGPETATLNEPFVYTLIVDNSSTTGGGPVPVTNVLVTDPLDPECFQFVSANASQGECFYVDGVLQCELGSMDPNDVVTIELTVVPIKTGMVENTATLTQEEFDPDPNNNIDTWFTEVFPGSQDIADIQVTLLSPDVIFTDQPFFLQSVVENFGPGDVTNLLAGTAIINDQGGGPMYDIIIDPATIGLSNGAPTNCQVSTFSSGTGVECDINISADMVLTYSYSATLQGNADGQVLITSFASGSMMDPNFDNNLDQTIIHVLTEPPVPLNITQTVAPNPVRAGGFYTTTLSITNTGNLNVSDWSSTYQVPEQTDVVTVNIPDDTNGDFVEDDFQVDWNLPPGQSLEVSLVMKVDEYYSEDALNSLWQTQGGGNTPIETPQTISVTPVVPPLLITSSSISDNTPQAGETLTATWSISNTGSVESYNTEWTAYLPLENSVIASNTAQGSLEMLTGTLNAEPVHQIQWNITTLDPGETAQLEISQQLLKSADGIQAYTYVVDADGVDPFTQTLSVDITGLPDTDMGVNVDNVTTEDLIANGGTGRVYLPIILKQGAGLKQEPAWDEPLVTNGVSQQDITNVIIEATVPPELAFADVMVNPESAEITRNDHDYTVRIPSIADNELVEIFADILATEVGSFLYEGTIDADVDDPDPSNNTFSVTIEVPTGVSVEAGDVPTTYALQQNYPNPFNPATRIGFAIPEPSHVVLRIYDAAGREVATVADRTFAPGQHTVTFDAGELPSGVYFYQIEAGTFTTFKAMVLLK